MAIGGVETDASRQAQTGRLTRECPVCGRLLGKEDPWDRVACECGWEW
jgi:hypothetical protein